MVGGAQGVARRYTGRRHHQDAGLARPRLCCMTRILFAKKIKSSFEFPGTITLTGMAGSLMWCAASVSVAGRP